MVAAAEAVAEVVVLLRRRLELLQTNDDACNELDRRKRLIQIALNSWHSYGTDTPYRDTCSTPVDSVLQKCADV